jgi:hypothetical protein
MSMLAVTGCAAFLAFASLIVFVGIGAQPAHAAATTYTVGSIRPRPT